VTHDAAGWIAASRRNFLDTGRATDSIGCGSESLARVIPAGPRPVKIRRLDERSTTPAGCALMHAVLFVYRKTTMPAFAGNPKRLVRHGWAASVASSITAKRTIIC
jgi:hypothetical protein